MKISRFPTSMRSMLALSIGLLAGFWGRSCRQQENHVEMKNVTVAAAPSSSEKATMKPEEPSTAAAMKWFRSLENKISNGDRLQPLTTAEIEQIESLTSEELGAWCKEGRRRNISYVLMDMLMERWAEIDRGAFVAWIDKLYEQAMPRTIVSFSYYDSNPPGVTAAMKVLRRLDPHGVMPIGKPRLGGWPIDYAPSSLAKTLRFPAPIPKPDFEQVSADEAVRWLAAHQNNFEELHDVAKRMAKKDIHAALAWAEAMPRHVKQRNAALKSILLEGKEKPEWLLEHVHLLNKKEDIEYVLNSASKLSGSDAGRTTLMKWAMSRERKAERAAGLAVVQSHFHSVSQKEAIELLALVRDGSERGNFMEAMMARYNGKEDWEGLLPLIKAEPGTGNGAMGAGSAAQQLAKQKSVAEALAWADSLPGDDRRSAAYGGVWQVWWKQDATAAAAAAVELPSGAQRTAAVQTVARSIGETAPIASLEWTRNLPPDDRMKIFPLLTEGLKQHHLTEAREEVLQVLQLAPAAGDDAAFSKAAASLMLSPETPTGRKQALQWLEKIPHNQLRVELLRSMKDNDIEVQ